MDNTKKRSLDLAVSASMDPLALNNVVVSMRPLVKKVRVQVIHKMTRQIKTYRNKKGTDLQKASNMKRAETLVLEVKNMKEFNVDKIAKFALGNTLTLAGVTDKGGTPEKALVKLSSNKLLQDKVESFRAQHDDWRSLAAFILSKNTGRRFKKKKKTSATAKMKVAIEEKQKTHMQMNMKQPENDSIMTDLTGESDKKKTDNVVEPEIVKKSEGSTSIKERLHPKTDLGGGDSESVDLGSGGSESVDLGSGESESVDLGSGESESVDLSSGESDSDDSKAEKSIEDNLSEKTDRLAFSVSKDTTDSGTDSEEGIDSKTIPSQPDEVVKQHQTRIKNKEMVIRKVYLDGLSDTVDSLPLGTSEAEDLSFMFKNQEGETDAVVKEKKKDPFFVQEGEDSDDDVGVRSGVLPRDSASEDEEEEQASNSRGRTAMRSTFLATLSYRKPPRPKNQSDKTRNPRKWQEKSQKGPWGQTKVGHQSRTFNPHTSGRQNPQIVKKGTGSHQKEEKLHPSWEASKKRKAQLGQIQAFQGKKIKFDD